MNKPEGLGIRSAPVRRLRRLLARRVEREAQGAFVVEGVRALETALDAGAIVEAIYAGPDVGSTGSSVLRAAAAGGIPVERLASGVAERVSDTVTPQGVLAVVRVPELSRLGNAALAALDDLSLVVVLADVREPGNAGTIVRSAEAAGASAVVFCRGSADAWSPKVVRASAGAVLYVPVVLGGGPREVLDVLAQRQVRRLGTAARGGVPHHEIDWSVPTALVLGNEAHGLGEPESQAVDGWVTIPIRGRAESLNVAMAASVLLFEATRRRWEGGAP